MAWAALLVVAGTLGVAPCGAADAPGVAELAVGNNADGRLEVFQVEPNGQLRHRWQRGPTRDWSSWASLGGALLPGVGVVNDRSGRLGAFAVERETGLVDYLFQREPNRTGWSSWEQLGGQAVQPPLAVARNAAGQVEVFAVAAGDSVVKRIRQTEAGTWAAWRELGGAILPGPMVRSNRTGQLELFGLSASTHSLVHCWQQDVATPDAWSAWQDLGQSLLPGFGVGQNADGRLEVVGVRADGAVVHAFQLRPRPDSAWSAWFELGAIMKPGVALERTADGRLEVFTVNPTNHLIFHTFEGRANASTNWVRWTDMSLVGGLDIEGRPAARTNWASLTDRGAATLSCPAVGKDPEGALEIFAFDEGRGDVLNHRRMIVGNLNWTDWLSLDRTRAQHQSRVWRLDDGLPDNRVQALAQSPEGYLWVGTHQGLARFDGVQLTVFDLTAVFGEPRPAISALLTGDDGTLWIGSQGAGLARLAGTEMCRYGQTNGLAGNAVTALCQGRDRSVWVGTTTGLSHYQRGKLVTYTTQQGLLADAIRSVFEDSEGKLWATTDKGLNGVAGTNVSRVARTNGLPDETLRGIWQDVPGRLWIGSRRGLILRRAGFYAYGTSFGLSDPNVNVVHTDTQGTLWVGTRSGLERFQDGAFLEELNDRGASFGTINTLFVDREGNLWAGSQNGLIRLTQKRFLLYGRREGLTHNNVTAVVEDATGTLWIGTSGGGLNQLQDQTVKPYLPGAKNGEQFVSALCQSRDGSLWVGSDLGAGLSQIQAGQVTRFKLPGASATTAVTVLHEDRSRGLWIGTSQGLSYFKQGAFATNGLPAPLAGVGVRAICEDPQGALWFGTRRGLSRWKDGQVTQWTREQGLADDAVTALYLDQDQTLWIGTEHGGLSRFRDGRFTSYSTKEGLFSDEILEILEDDFGWLWMSCSKGIFRVRKDQFEALEGKGLSRLTSIPYGYDDGMQSVLCSAGKPGGWKTRDGQLWFPTSEGLVAIDPKAVHVSLQPPPVYLEQLVADHQALLPGDQWLRPRAPGDRVSVPPGHGDLEFRYTALHFQRPEKLRFKYRLEGVDRDWVEADTRRVAYYNNLHPGRYRFQVMACNNSGVWNERGASLDVVVLPHVWQTWWFQSGLGLLLLAGGVGAVRYMSWRRLKWKLERLERQTALARERSRIAQDMHDDLGARLSEIILHGNLALKANLAPEKTRDLVGRMTNAAHELVDNLDAIVWAVNPKNDALERTVDYICEYVQAYLESAGIGCSLEVPRQVPACALSSEVRHNLFLAIKEALHNVVKHARASQVRLTLRVEAGSLQVHLEDDGQGFSPETKSALGNGLESMEQRLKRLGGAYRLDTAPGQGTRLHFQIPLLTD